MYFFYVDESGVADPQLEGTNSRTGEKFAKDPLYVLAAISLYDHRWRPFDATLNGKKRDLINQIYKAEGLRFDLASCELKSAWARIPRERKAHQFLSRISDDQLTELCDLYYAQLDHHNMQVFAVVIDKRHLHDYMNFSKVHRKAWELLLERIECYLWQEHPKHQGVLITDDISVAHNRSLAMKHAFFQSHGTSRMRLQHIAEMPLFVRSELSNGVQLADLVAYSVYRRFKYPDTEYGFFDRIEPYIWRSAQTDAECLDGLYVFPPQSPLVALREELGKKQGRPVVGRP